MLLQYSLHEPRRGHADIKVFMTDFRAAFPDLSFGAAADLIAEGDYVIGRWVGGGTHSGPAFSDFLGGSLPVATGRKMHFTGTTVLRLENGKIVEEIGLDDGVTALTQLGLICAVQQIAVAVAWTAAAYANCCQQGDALLESIGDLARIDISVVTEVGLRLVLSQVSELGSRAGD